MLADPIGEVNADKSPTETRNPVCRAVRRLRVDLGDTQQQFANRLGLAISTVVRYEISRPPHGKALAQLERLAMENGLDECALIFRNSLREELGGSIQGEQVRPPSAETFGLECFPRTPEEEALIFDVLQVAREASRTEPPSNDATRRGREQAKREMKLLMRATARVRASRIESDELVQADLDLTAAIIRLHNLGVPKSEITDRLRSSKHIRVWTDDGPLPKVEAVLAEYEKKNAKERKSK